MSLLNTCAKGEAVWRKLDLRSATSPKQRSAAHSNASSAHHRVPGAGNWSDEFGSDASGRVFCREPLAWRRSARPFSAYPRTTDCTISRHSLVAERRTGILRPLRYVDRVYQSTTLPLSNDRVFVRVSPGRDVTPSNIVRPLPSTVFVTTIWYSSMSCACVSCAMI